MLDFIKVQDPCALELSELVVEKCSDIKFTDECIRKSLCGEMLLDHYGK